MGRKLAIVISILCVIVSSIISFAEPKTAFDYATISESEWRAIDEENKARESIEQDIHKREVKQKNKDRLTGPGAIETTGSIVIGETQPIPEEMQNVDTINSSSLSDENVVRAIDLKYGIIFESKKKFVTNVGEFNLKNAVFEDYNWTEKKNYRFKLEVENMVKAKTTYFLYLKAYDAVGNFVDGERVVVDPHKLTTNIVLYIYGNNDFHISKIEFSLDPLGMDPTVLAKKYVSTTNYKVADAVSDIMDPAHNLTDEQRNKLLDSYYKEVEECTKEYQKDIIDRGNDVVEIK